MTQDSSPPVRDPLTERIERLLARHAESTRKVTSLEALVSQLTQERDVLQQRMTQASQRLDAVIEHIPQWASLDTDNHTL